MLTVGWGGCPFELSGGSEGHSSGSAQGLSRCPGIYSADRFGRFPSQPLLRGWNLLGLSCFNDS